MATTELGLLEQRRAPRWSRSPWPTSSAATPVLRVRRREHHRRRQRQRQLRHDAHAVAATAAGRAPPAMARRTSAVSSLRCSIPYCAGSIGGSTVTRPSCPGAPRSSPWRGARRASRRWRRAGCARRSSSAMRKPPLLKGPSAPVWLRVPSGAIQTPRPGGEERAAGRAQALHGLLAVAAVDADEARGHHRAAPHRDAEELGLGDHPERSGERLEEHRDVVEALVVATSRSSARARRRRARGRAPRGRPRRRGGAWRPPGEALLGRDSGTGAARGCRRRWGR